MKAVCTMVLGLAVGLASCQGLTRRLPKRPREQPSFEQAQRYGQRMTTPEMRARGWRQVPR
jgi:hypothetical protein